MQASHLECSVEIRNHIDSSTRGEIPMADISSHNSTNALLTTLTAPGAPFRRCELSIQGFSRRVFCNAPQSFAGIYRMALPFGPRTMIVSETAQMSYAKVFSKAAALEDISQTPEWCTAAAAGTANCNCHEQPTRMDGLIHRRHSDGGNRCAGQQSEL